MRDKDLALFYYSDSKTSQEKEECGGIDAQVIDDFKKEINRLRMEVATVSALCTHHSSIKASTIYNF